MLKVLQESAWEEEPVLHRFSPHCFSSWHCSCHRLPYGNIRRNCSGTYCSGYFDDGVPCQIKWDEFEEAVSAFFTVVVMPFTYSISTELRQVLYSM